MKLRLSNTAVSANTLAYTWYLAKAADRAFPKKSFQPTRLTVYARVGVNGRCAASHKNKATSGQNKVFWRAQLPSKGLFALSGGLALFFSSQLIFAQVTKGLTGLGVWVYAQSLQVSPLLLFGYILIIHIALRHSLNFFKKPQSRRTVVSYLKGRSAQGIWSPLRIFSLSAATAASVCWAGFGVCTDSHFREQSRSAARPDHCAALAPLHGLQRGFVRLAPSQVGGGAKVPTLVFKLNDLSFLAQYNCPTALSVPALFVDSYSPQGVLVGVLPHSVASRTRALGSEIYGLSWPSIPSQMLQRTTTARVLLSAWHVFSDTLEEQGARFGVFSASKIPSYSGGMGVLPLYAKAPGWEKRGLAGPASIDPRILPEVNALRSLVSGVAFRVPTLYDNVTLTYTRFPLFAPRPTKGKIASLEASLSLSWETNLNLPQLRSSARAGLGVGFSSVQTASHSVKTKPWRRI